MLILGLEKFRKVDHFDFVNLEKSRLFRIVHTSRLLARNDSFFAENSNAPPPPLRLES